MSSVETRSVTRPSADETRERILTAALDCFSEFSFEGATTRAIATRAGVTQPLLNYHFHGKEDLWRAAIDRLFGQLNGALAARIEGLRGVDEYTTMKLIVREFVVYSAANPQLHRIITQECKTDGPRVAWMVDTYVKPLFETTTARLQALADAGRMPDVPVSYLYYILTGAGTSMFVLAPECRMLPGVDPFEPEVVDRYADAVVALLFGEAHPAGRRG